MTNEIDHTVSSGNVFADIGVANPDEAATKADLAFEINNLIERRRLTQTESAKALKINQPKVSASARGKLDGFSIERPLRLHANLGTDVQIVPTPRETMSGKGRIRVVAQ